MTTQTRKFSPTFLARATGLLLIVMAVCAVFSEFAVRGSLIVPGDAAATAGRILASEQIFRFGLLGYLVAFLCDVPVSIFLYVLLRPVSTTLALTAMSFRLVYTAVAGANLLSYLAALVVLSGGNSFSTIPPEQLHAHALLFLTVFDHGFSLSLVFFGVHLLLLGVLLWRSTVFPRVFGGLIALAGLSYLVDSFSFFLAPSFNATVAPFLVLPAMTELVLAFWLVIKGARPPVQDGRAPS